MNRNFINSIYQCPMAQARAWSCRIMLMLPMLVVLSCGPETQADKGLNGIWQSVGYGWILEIRDSTAYGIYDITEISCITAREASLEEIGGALALRNDTLFLKRGVLTYRFIRGNGMPESCKTPGPDPMAYEPLYNFDVFSRTVEDHYVFMELNGISWDSLRLAQREKVASSPRDTTLYRVLGETLDLLRDNHAYLEASEALYAELDQAEESPQEGSLEEESMEYGDFQVAALAAGHHLEEELTRDSWLIQWGWMAEGTAYVQIKAMWLYADLQLPEHLIEEKGFVDAYVETFHQMDEGSYIQMEVTGVRNIMSRVVDDLANADRMVLDVRFNGGGQDAVSFEILRYFNEKRRKVGLQQVKAGDSLSPVQPLYLEASERPFLKPVYILTSGQTGSAAESFALASRSLPHAKRIGAPTSGALSTALEKQLPNGWHFSISNELFMDAYGKFYENRGIPVDFELPFPEGRQPFFRAVADQLDLDRENIGRAIEDLEAQAGGSGGPETTRN